MNTFLRRAVILTALITSLAPVTKGADVTPPTLISAQPLTPDLVTVKFSEPLQASATNLANYTVDGGVTISSATLSPSGDTITLKTSALATGTTYKLTVSNIKDVAANTIVSTNQSFGGVIAGTGLTLQRYFDNLTGGDPTLLVNDPRYPSNPTSLTLEPLFEYPPNGANEAGDNYDNELSGWFTPPTTGDYIFFLCSDDNSNLYLSTDDNPANKKLIARETSWSNARQWTTSGGTSDLPSKRSDQFPGTTWPSGNKITLTAGQHYYMQALHHEGGGGDNVGVLVEFPGTADPADGDPSLDSKYITLYVPQGASDAFPAFNLSSAVGGPGPGFNQVTLNFSFNVNTTNAIANLANFSIPGLTISSAVVTPDGKGIVLNTSAQAAGTNYTVTVKNLTDMLGRSLPANTSAAFSGFILGRGEVIQKFWAAIGGNTIADLTSDPRFPNTPTFTTLEPRFEYPPNGGNEAGDNYGNQLSGLLIPPVTGNYVFFLCSDDLSELYLSTDDNPANKKLIATETVWSNARQWTTSGGNSDLPSKRSDQFPGTAWPTGATITLTAGKSYYMEALHTEGGGGDNVGVAWMKPGETAPPADGTPAIDGGYFGNFLPGASVTITQQPTSLTIAQSTKATFSVGASSSSVITYQWQKAAVGGSFTNIADAIGSSYTTGFIPLTDNGTRYRVIVNGVGSTVTSSAATLTVSSDTTPPTLASAARSFTNQSMVVVQFSEPLGASANTAANFKINGTTVTSAVLGSDFKTVTLTAATPIANNSTNTVTVSGVSDIAGNVILASSSIAFPGFGLYLGLVEHNYWSAISGGVAGLTADPRFPNNPTTNTLEPRFEYPPNGGNEAGDNYGNELHGFIIPPVTGNYVFFLCSDDQSDLYLSTDNNPANVKHIATETAWSNARQWGAVASGGSSDLPSKRSDQYPDTEWPTGGTITLTAGKMYYIQALHVEGGGGDNVGVAWDLPGNTAAPADGSPPIDGGFIANLLPPDYVTIASAARNSTNHNAVSVRFSGPLGVSANTAANFKLNGVAATSAVLGPDAKTVLLTFATAIANGSTNAVTVSGLLDLAGNPVQANSPVPVGLKSVLFVGADPGPLTFAGDIAAVNHLLDRGFDVQLTTGSAVPDDGSTALGKDLVVESSSLGSGTTVAAAGGSKFKNVAVPVIEWEPSNQDDFQFQATNGLTTASLTQINIVDPTSPLAAGFPAGVLTVLSAPDTISQGAPVGAHIVATLPADLTQAVLYDYEKGDKGFNGFVMPARRVFFFFQDNTAANANAAGWKIFDATVDWAMGVQSTGGTQPTLSVSHSGNNVTISWTNGGTLQSTTSLKSPITWATETTTSPFTTAASGTAKFYRVTQ